MENNTRYRIYKEAASLLEENRYKGYVASFANHLEIAATILRDLEDNDHLEEEHGTGFLDLLRGNLHHLSVKRYDFGEIVDGYLGIIGGRFFPNEYSYYKKRNKRYFEGESRDKESEEELGKKNYEKESYKSCLRDLILLISYTQNRVFKDNQPIYELMKNDRPNIRNRVFLSYAYVDKGLSFALFIYFLSHNAFLFVDWMWNDKIENVYILKEGLENEIYNSNQFLLLRTPSSEYGLKYSRQVRQWCSWECGLAYSRYPDEKFTVAFFHHDVLSNVFLEDFKKLGDVDCTDGRMIPLY